MDKNRKRDLKQLNKRDTGAKLIFGELKVHVLDD